MEEDFLHFCFPQNLTRSYLCVSFNCTARNSSLNMKHVFYLEKTISCKARLHRLTSTEFPPAQSGIIDPLPAPLNSVSQHENLYTEYPASPARTTPEPLGTATDTVESYPIPGLGYAHPDIFPSDPQLQDEGRQM